MAESFWSRQKTRSGQGVIQYAWDNRTLSGTVTMAGTTGVSVNASGDALFYVFRSTTGKGFVIVSADDQVMPVLAYSLVDEAPQPDNLPDGLQDWIAGIAEEIQYVRSNGIENPQAAQMWTRATTGNTVVELETAKWKQTTPFNDQCPYDGSERSLAGCIPVASAIVMQYYKWPESGTGTTESYYTSTKNLYVESRNLEQPYDWDNMPVDYTSPTEAESDAASRLIADIGSAMQSDYAADETLTTMDITVLYQNFGYNPGMTHLQRSKYSDEVWLQMIKDDLDALRPVFYSGTNTSAHHQFVLDGYTDSDYFHVNWGWGGSSDGYFTLSNLAPGSKSAYSDGQWACFNVEPKSSDEAEDWIKFRSPGIVISETNFTQNRRFTIDAVYFENDAAAPFTGSFRGAVTDRDGNIIEWITNTLTPSNGINTNYYHYWTNLSATITQPIGIGYRIRFFYKSSTSDEWKLVKSNGGTDCQWEVLIADEYSISESTSFTYDKSDNVIVLNTKEGVSATLYSSSGRQITNGLSVADNVITIDMKELSQEVYTIELKKGNDTKTLEFAVKSMNESL